jgi:hypothetical protein
MSPEQRLGKAADKRTDIWSFGAVLYEMMSGRRAFAGESTSDILAAVLKLEPDWSVVPKKTPGAIRRLIRRCLTKDRRQRLQAIGEARIVIEDCLSGPQPKIAEPAPPKRSIMLWATAGVLAIVAIATSVITWHATRPVDHPLTRLNVDLGPEAMTGLNLTCAISPDGRRLVFAARGPDGKQYLANRLLDQAEATLLPGTEAGSQPFFSPDGQWIGFYGAGQLKKISVQGGAPVALHAIPGPALYGGAWGNDASILAPLSGGRPLSRIPAAGGMSQPPTKFGPGEVSHRWLQVLPGGAVLFTASPAASGWENANIEAISPRSGQVKIVQHGGYYGRYLPSGHLVYVHQGTLFAVKFDPVELEVHGAALPVLEGVAANPTSGGGQFDFSSTGTFAYAAGKSVAQAWRLDWLDSAGKTYPLLSVPGVYAWLRLSPDGRKVAFGNGEDIFRDIFVYDMDRDTTSRLTFTAGVGMPVWAPDGKHLVFGSRADGFGIFWVRGDGAGPPQRLLATAVIPGIYAFSPDGRRLAYGVAGAGTGSDIWTLPLDLSDPEHPKPGKPEPLLVTPAGEGYARFSPDGRWIAYWSNESGTAEIYVRPFPTGSGGKWQI